MKTLVLNNKQVKDKIKRMAYQIVEDSYDQKQIALLGIKRRGLTLAGLLAAEIKLISTIDVVEGYIRIKKDNPVFDDITSDLDLNSLADTDIVIVDDVANSGRTLMFALKPFMNGVFKKIRIAVLVDRAHKKFPVCPDFVGYSMATTIKNRIELVFHVDNTAEAFLTE